MNVDGGGALEAVFNVFELVVSGTPVDESGEVVAGGPDCLLVRDIVFSGLGMQGAIVLVSAQPFVRIEISVFAVVTNLVIAIAQGFDERGQCVVHNLHVAPKSAAADEGLLQVEHVRKVK